MPTARDPGTAAVTLPRFLPPGDEGTRFLMGSLDAYYKVIPGRPGEPLVTGQLVPAGVLVAPHVHERQDQIRIVTQGTLGFLVGDTTYTGQAGSLIFAERDVPHALWNPGPGPARMIEISTPGGEIFEFFQEFDGLTRGGRVTAETLQEAAAPYGITYRPDLIPGLESAHQVSASGGWWAR